MTGTNSIARTLKLAPQVRRILAHLLQGKTISPVESEHVYRISRLSDCILKIRRAGYDVTCEVKRDPVGRKYGRYSLNTAASVH